MIPKSHPRYLSLMTRESIVRGVKKGITSPHGLIAQGRGEAFDYLLGEKTHPFALASINAAAALLLTARHPVLSINGNAAALAARDMSKLAKMLRAPLEVNIFHASKKRERNIMKELRTHGGKILLPSRKTVLPFIDHNRRFAHPFGIMKADVVLVPLEDGDRCAALVEMGKKVITIDLNPFSRTACTADITIVDNIVRALPLLCSAVERFRKTPLKDLEKMARMYKNKTAIEKARLQMRKNLD